MGGDILPTQRDKYDGRHKRERARWVPSVNRGEVDCHADTCLMPSRRIEPGDRWDLGHDPTGTTWTGPEHERCNRSEGATRGNRARVCAGWQEW